MPALSPCHAEALRLLELGYRPIAVDPVEKQPWYPWKEYQSRQPTPAEIDQWFTQRPHAGVGITTDGLIVLDIDGPDTVWPPNRECAYDLMGTPQVSTPRGGSHFYFRQTPGKPHRGTIGQIAEHVDTRADGNLIVLPPTIRPGAGQYEWCGPRLDCGPLELAVPPDWFQAAIDAIDTNRVSLYVSKPFTDSIPTGQRDKTYFRFACLMRDVGADQQRIFGALAGMAAYDTNPLDQRQLSKIAASAAKYDPTPTVDTSGIGVNKEPARLLTMDELQALPPPKWLIEDVIQDNGLGILVGEPGSGKSLFMLAVVNSVARGTPLLGQKAVHRTGWVLVLLAESVASWGARSAAYNSYHGVGSTDCFAAMIDGVDFSNPRKIEELSVIVRQEVNRRGEYPALIVLDTVSAAIPGVDENSAAAVTPLLATLNGWVRYGIPVVAIHHPSKAGSEFRGSSAFRGNVDWMIGIKVYGNRREIINHKMRDLESVNQLAFEVVKHGNSIVAVACAGPAASFMAFAEPGLMDAFRDHAFYIPGQETRRPVRGLDFKTGVTPRDLMETWRGTAPIVPASATDREGYKTEVRRREGKLIEALNSLIDDGRLICEKRLTFRSMGELVVQPTLTPQSDTGHITYAPCVGLEGVSVSCRTSPTE